MTTFACHHQQVSRNEDTDLIYDRKRRTKKEDTYVAHIVSSRASRTLDEDIIFVSR